VVRRMFGSVQGRMCVFLNNVINAESTEMTTSLESMKF
jgi:hypothetical protein